MASDPSIERCRREQQEIMNRQDVVAGEVPAWLVMLGVEDWEMEIRLIEADGDYEGSDHQARPHHPRRYPQVRHLPPGQGD